MEAAAQEQQNKSRVVKVDSVESWETFVSQANNQGCPVRNVLLTILQFSYQNVILSITLSRWLLLQVVVHFTAIWCMPSVAMNPLFEELASAYPDVLFLSVDVDDVKVIFFPLHYIMLYSFHFVTFFAIYVVVRRMFRHRTVHFLLGMFSFWLGKWFSQSILIWFLRHSLINWLNGLSFKYTPARWQHAKLMISICLFR